MRAESLLPSHSGSYCTSTATGVVGTRPRTVYRSRELLASAEAQTFSAEIAELVRKTEAGEDLTPHLSRAVDTAFLSAQERAALPQHQREKDLDRMLADWGIHHLHLSNELEADGFV